MQNSQQGTGDTRYDAEQTLRDKLEALKASGKEHSNKSGQVGKNLATQQQALAELADSTNQKQHASATHLLKSLSSLREANKREATSIRRQKKRIETKLKNLLDNEGERRERAVESFVDPSYTQEEKAMDRVSASVGREIEGLVKEATKLQTKLDRATSQLESLDSLQARVVDMTKSPASLTDPQIQAFAEDLKGIQSRTLGQRAAKAAGVFLIATAAAGITLLTAGAAAPIVAAVGAALSGGGLTKLYDKFRGKGSSHRSEHAADKFLKATDETGPRTPLMADLARATAEVKDQSAEAKLLNAIRYGGDPEQTHGDEEPIPPTGGPGAPGQ